MDLVIKKLRTFIMFTFFLLSFTVAYNNESRAESDLNNNGLTTALCNVAKIVTGTWGKLVGTAAIMFIGFGALLGKITWGVVILVCTGIGIIFFAPTLVLYITTGSGGNASDDSSACSLFGSN